MNGATSKQRGWGGTRDRIVGGQIWVVSVHRGTGLHGPLFSPPELRAWVLQLRIHSLDSSRNGLSLQSRGKGIARY